MPMQLPILLQLALMIWAPCCCNYTRACRKAASAAPPEKRQRRRRCAHAMLLFYVLDSAHVYLSVLSITVYFHSCVIWMAIQCAKRGRTNEWICVFNQEKRRGSEGERCTDCSFLMRNSNASWRWRNTLLAIQHRRVRWWCWCSLVYTLTQRTQTHTHTLKKRLYERRTMSSSSSITVVIFLRQRSMRLYACMEFSSSYSRFIRKRDQRTQTHTHARIQHTHKHEAPFVHKRTFYFGGSRWSGGCEILSIQFLEV